MKFLNKLSGFILLATLITSLAACGDTSSTPTTSNSISDNSTSTVTTLPTLDPTSTSLPISTATSAPTIALPSPTAVPVSAHTVVIDPGHGGIDWGTFHTNASGKIDLKEKDVALPLGLKTADILRADGINVVLTRTTDRYFNDKDYNGDGKIDGFDDLQARVDIANQSKADLFFSIHTNSSVLKNEVGGVETWWGSGRPFSDQNKLFAKLIQQFTLSSLKSIGYAALDRGANDDLELDKTGDHIFVLGPYTRNHKSVTSMPGALTEILFITNDQEAAILENTNDLNAIADGYAKAIEAYFKQTASS